MELIPEWAPNIHPLIIHFPIAIILLAVLMDFLNLFLPDKWWDDLKQPSFSGLAPFQPLLPITPEAGPMSSTCTTG